MTSPIENLRKFLRLEIDSKFGNRAIIGGFERLIPNWEIEARQADLDDEFIAAVILRLNEYKYLDLDVRPAAVQELLHLLDEKEPPRKTEHQAPEQTPVLQNNSAVSHPVHQPSTHHPPSNEQQDRRDSRSFNTMGLDSPLTVLSGIGPSYAKKLASIDLYTLGDLLYYFPRRYDDYSKLKPINRLQVGDELSVIGTIYSIENRQIRNNSLTITEAVVTDGTGFLRVSWFNQSWISSRIPVGTQVVLAGKVDLYLGRVIMNSPEWELVERDHLNTNRIVPVYPLTAGITQKFIRRLMFQAVPYWAPRIPDPLPKNTLQETNLPSLSKALLQIHFPESMDELHQARERIAFDEIFLLQLGVLRQKKQWEKGTARTFTPDLDWQNNLISSLPYSLTNAQQRAFEDIRHDLSSGRPMNRLLQGDVGSGKTLVAALAVALVLRDGAQAAVMAPTSILADQHYKTFTKLLTEKDEFEGILKSEEIRLLIGSTPEGEKAEIREGLVNGQVKLVIGTHALLEDPVEFQQLQLAIVDEQHRFGVNQRAKLRSKGENPHLLVMTATPIPRSLALTMYGDLDLTVMDEMPVGRQPIETFVLHPLERERAHQLVRHEIEKGHQAFIIYPLVEQGKEDEGKAAVEEQARLQASVFPHLKIGLLHGRLRPDEKDEVMARFQDREYQILVSTSVVEVGVDVPNATVMLIEGANRFGLAQLHQFRGRVGRGPEKSYCLLIPEVESSVENERLMVMAETNDGFILAEKDLEQRGPGQFLGTQQSGFPELKIASLTDVHLIEKARNLAMNLFESDPELSRQDNFQLNKSFRRFWSSGRGDIS